MSSYHINYNVLNCSRMFSEKHVHMLEAERDYYKKLCQYFEDEFRSLFEAIESGSTCHITSEDGKTTLYFKKTEGTK